MAQDFALRDHQEWINYLQPEGLVVSARALVEAQAVLDRAELLPLQTRFRSVVIEDREGDEPRLRPDLDAIVRDFLQWPTEYIDGWDGQALPGELVYENADLGVRIAPKWALRAKEPKEGDPRWILLVDALAPGVAMDTDTEEDRSGWKTTPSRRFGRLLRETKVPIGVIADERSVRLIFAPPQENTGTLTFPLAAMTENAGRKILGGFHTLLCRERLFTGPRESRLPALLERSRKTQAAVSTALAEQVLASLYELVRGFQAADARARGELLRDQLAQHPDHIYQGLLNVLLRLITLLYAEDRALLPQSDLFVRNYSLRGLFERLQGDAERNPDTMDHRYGAWSQLLVMFRLVEGGCRNAALSMPARRGSLFDPARFPFLDGRTLETKHVPLVPDGTVHRVLRNLLIVDGERLSYRTLDVEHIGSVYETMMGFRMERATGPSIALKPAKKGGAPTTIDLEKLLAEPATKRATWVKQVADQKIDGQAADALRSASSLEALRTALGRKIADTATPDIVARGSMVLQPSDERRKSGSHYTPRSLTEPIVRKTLEPIFARLGPDATEGQVLDLRVCDPAVGSGAFLVETCRQLAQRLKLAWERHRVTPKLPPDEDVDIYAMRMVAQHCLYGVDKNPVAVDLAKLSLWLATLARDHAFTFLDHALKCGDSLVGLDRAQLLSFHWKPQKQLAFVSQAIGQRVEESLALREKVRNAPDGMDEAELRELHAAAEAKTETVRWVCDLVIAAFFAADSDRKREAERKELEDVARAWLEAGAGAAAVRARVGELRAADIEPLHWWLAFPEVFARTDGGFDALIGNPPFVNGTSISTHLGQHYKEWLYLTFDGAGNRMDLCAYFLRRSFQIMRATGSSGFVATNTIAQGDTRVGGLGHICKSGGTIYAATKRHRWTGGAAVIVSIVHLSRSQPSGCWLDGRQVDAISAYLVPGDFNDEPRALAANRTLASLGVKPYADGFFVDSPQMSPDHRREVDAILELEPAGRTYLRPYIGGEDINSTSDCGATRTIIDFSAVTDKSKVLAPKLLEYVASRVQSDRAGAPKEVRAAPAWLFFRTREDFLTSLRATQRVVLVHARVSSNLSWTVVPSDWVVSETAVIVRGPVDGGMCVLQSRIHEVWSRYFSSTLKDDLLYTVSDCLENFPFPSDCVSHTNLNVSGKTYYTFRAELMNLHNEGLTKTYNRFHSNDPQLVTPEIVELRRLHAMMDRAVLDAYGWSDIPTTCDFFPDYFELDDNGTEVPKSIRYRWPDEVRDEVLARLLALNQHRYEEEVRLGLHAPPSNKKRGAKKKHVSSPDMFDGDDEE